METFDKHGVRLAVTQQLDTPSPLGRLGLNLLLSLAQFEREIIAERTRDKMSAARRKGNWVGGIPVLSYHVDPKTETGDQDLVPRPARFRAKDTASCGRVCACNRT